MSEVTARCCEPKTGEDASLLRAEVVAVTGDVGHLVEQRLERRVLGPEQGGALDLGTPPLEPPARTGSPQTPQATRPDNK
jgi:hypothetical protein